MLAPILYKYPYGCVWPRKETLVAARIGGPARREAPHPLLLQSQHPQPCGHGQGRVEGMLCREECGGKAPWQTAARAGGWRWQGGTRRRRRVPGVAVAIPARLGGRQGWAAPPGCGGRAGKWELRWALCRAEPPVRGDRTPPGTPSPAWPGAGIHPTALQAPRAPAAATPTMRGEAPAMKLKPDVQSSGNPLTFPCSAPGAVKAPPTALAPEFLLPHSPSVP